MKIVITGPPQSGKTTLADTLGKVLTHAVWHTDELKDLDWSEQSRVVSEWFDEPGDWIIEGVTVPRAIRKWREAHTDADPPFDKLIVIRKHHGRLLLQGQKTLSRQVLDLIDNFRNWSGEKWLDL